MRKPLYFNIIIVLLFVNVPPVIQGGITVKVFSPEFEVLKDLKKLWGVLLRKQGYFPPSVEEKIWRGIQQVKS